MQGYLYIGGSQVLPVSVAKNENTGDIITAKNATGAAISEGDKVWIEKRAEGGIQDFSEYNSSTYTLSNQIITFNQIGTVQSGTGIGHIDKVFVSNFNTPTDYVEAQVKVMGNTYTRTDIRPYDDTNLISFFGGLLRISPTNTTNGLYYVFNRGGSYGGGSASSGYLFAPSLYKTNTWYWVKVRATTTNITITWSTDGIQWNSGATISGNHLSRFSNYSTSYSIYCMCRGYSNFSYVGGGVVDLSETYVKADDKIWWTPYLDSQIGLNYLPYNFSSSSSLTGFAMENIVDGSTGDAKTVMPGTISVSVTADANDAAITLE